MELSDREILRYAGFKGHTPDEATKEKIESLKSEILNSVTPKSIFKEVSFSFPDSETLLADGTAFKSKKLVSHFKGSQALVLFAATLGVESDLILRKYSVTDSSKYVLAQAVLTEMTERYSDEMCRKLSQPYLNKGLYLMPRFSAGYADMALSEQKKFFELLDINKRIGISLNDDYLMTPSKSITAFIGFSKKESCSAGGCALCNKTDCEFRRETDELSK